MNPTPPSTDPGYVFKRVGFALMAASLGVTVLLILYGPALENKYQLFFFLAAMGLPFVGGLALASAWFRDLLLNLADRLPFVKFTRDGSPPS